MSKAARWAIAATVLSGAFVPVLWAQDAVSSLRVNWKPAEAGEGAESRALKTWSLADLRGMKQQGSREKDPRSGKMFDYKGVVLSDLVDQALEALPSIPDRSRIDLVILKNAKGERAFVPRAFAIKHPMIIAHSRDGKPAEGGLQSVVPWSSRTKVLGEPVPLEKFFLSNVSEIELASYGERYGQFRLKRRTDPLVMRGEKLFFQSCVNCHAAGTGPAIHAVASEAAGRRLASDGHPTVKGAPRLEGRERQAISAYLDSYRAEASFNPVLGPTSAAR